MGNRLQRGFRGAGPVPQTRVPLSPPLEDVALAGAPGAAHEGQSTAQHPLPGRRCPAWERPRGREDAEGEAGGGCEDVCYSVIDHAPSRRPSLSSTDPGYENVQAAPRPARRPRGEPETEYALLRTPGISRPPSCNPEHDYELVLPQVPTGPRTPGSPLYRWAKDVHLGGLGPPRPQGCAPGRGPRLRGAFLRPAPAEATSGLMDRGAPGLPPARQTSPHLHAPSPQRNRGPRGGHRDLDAEHGE
ncbi:PREDICTED: germinal center-associated signaling and motility-like protein [Condylura cristata]|uniref:germinal center-associated signaling and motility-like protein n=1 Tax=Condylura cristata TaxID=143302 RepID=UPI000642AAF5|nr:PREDICTED: germinal center-associated signaling and motility-like protein [Condylura cristata]